MCLQCSLAHCAFVSSPKPGLSVNLIDSRFSIFSTRLINFFLSFSRSSFSIVSKNSSNGISILPFGQAKDEEIMNHLPRAVV